MGLYLSRRRRGGSLRTRLGVLLAVLVVSLLGAPAATSAPVRALTGTPPTGTTSLTTLTTVTAPAPAAVVLADGAVASRVAVGFRHTCALTRTGGVQCWGDNTYGQLGRGTTGAPSGVAQWVVGLRSGVASLSAGEDHTCAVTTAGAVRCWGSNTWGMLGDGTTIDRSLPVTTSGLTSGVRSVSPGGQQTCAQRTTGAVLCWGWNGSGGLGDGTTTDRLRPVAVRGLPTDVTSVSAGATYACAVTSGGRLWCWGGSQWLAGAGEYNALTTPRLVQLTGVRQFAARLDRTCAVTTAGATWCWGGPGELGDGRNYAPEAPVPARVETLGDGTTSTVAPGQSSTCVLTPAGAVLCWGSGDPGLDDLLLGNQRTLGAWRPQPVTGLGSGVLQVENNYNHHCALTAAGVVLCWGRNVEGQLGRGNVSADPWPSGTATSSSSSRLSAPASPSSPRSRRPGSSDVRAAHQWRTGAIAYRPTSTRSTEPRTRPHRSGTDVRSGQDGIRESGSTSTAGTATVAALPTVAQVATGTNHACARTTGGRLWCWGSNTYGQAPGDEGSFTTTPSEVPGLTNVSDAGLGDGTTCAVASARVWCWGLNLDHQVSPSTDAYVVTPTRYAALTSSTRQVASGLGLTCALSTAGGVRCWGSNFIGGLGNGSSVDRSATPVTPTGLGSGVASLADGAPRCVVMTTGQVRCWSFSSPTGSSTTPVVIPLPAPATSVSVGEASCALLTTGAVHCWGDNRFGYLGDGTLTPTTSPRPVVGLGSGVGAISSGGGVTCAVLTAGTTRCWGSSSAGLGNVSVYSSSVPWQTGTTGAAVRQVAVGSGFACALDARPSLWCWGDSYSGQLALPLEAPKQYSRLPVRIG
ncbi:chromosome condensation regulator RCC1 [Knoellia locipacati]|uniref:Chromosome condensation regulator RCC1 n=1 Tax=Knoellia locipacati TaxID=882824 RepID=A0A512T2C8_9MICO|nr:hypothetical protein [Knoellia locipacati]GEQ14356.1 chromosome condensation regulator RCC1 [Knoellia locipacati]